MALYGPAERFKWLGGTIGPLAVNGGLIHYRTFVGFHALMIGTCVIIRTADYMLHTATECDLHGLRLYGPNQIPIGE